ncbi:MAG: hypothetical protein KTR35_05385 [Gammaproteobacteria bacterium]|nr:hypothetical protein [Gammaproteobacteria bacterium]
MKITLDGDHAGFDYKNALIAMWESIGVDKDRNCELTVWTDSSGCKQKNQIGAVDACKI